jgi:hypothetical protein
MALRHALALTLCAALPGTAALTGAPALAQNTPITNPPSVITPPAALLPDLFLPGPQITAVCNANKTVSITLKATFKNVGGGPATFNASQLVAGTSYGFGSGTVNLVNQDSKPVPNYIYGPLTIGPGASHTVYLSIGPLSRYKPLPTPGMYLATARINPNKSIAESNYNNNGSGKHIEDPCFGK